MWTTLQFLIPTPSTYSQFLLYKEVKYFHEPTPLSLHQFIKWWRGEGVEAGMGDWNLNKACGFVTRIRNYLEI